MVNSGAYARKLGKKVSLIGIEADSDHLVNAITTLKDNGFSEDEFCLANGVAAPSAGVALFPVLEQPGEDWGGEAVFNPTSEKRDQLLETRRYRESRCYPLADLADGSAFDLLHIDIQGAEVDFIKGNFADTTSCVRRVLIGTHSRLIEGQLMDHFLKNGWSLEIDRPVINAIVDGRPDIRIDGVQMWWSRSASL